MIYLLPPLLRVAHDHTMVRGRVEVVRLLLERGFSPDAHETYADALVEEGNCIIIDADTLP